MTNDLLQCALGVHRFDEKITEDLFRCSVCKRARHYKDSSGYEIWREYNENGNCIFHRNSHGYEWRKE